ncbi:sensor histidine kinase [Intrasporangium flavum]|uniref:sensor histidine kinase n=1 Tax=Intrasporangium flavum TaxID=1428657 RepID=UPI001A9672F1|nr:histidine kinase [Intrasporangium flavum]
MLPPGASAPPVRTTLASGPPPVADQRLPTRRRLLVRLAATVAAVLVLVVAGASWAASRLAEREAVNDAAHTTNLLATSVVQPALRDGLLTADSAAVAAFDRVVRDRVLPAGIVRVKLWRPDGTVVYADDARLVGQRFALADDQREALSSPQTRAEVSDLERSENEFERYGGKLLEVYRPVWTPSGAELLFEVYGDYAPVQDRAFELWRGLSGVLATSLLLLVALLAPVLWRLLERLEAARAQREDLLRRAVDASDRERRRIAADLHDGPVQDLVASALAVSGAAERVRADGRPELAAPMVEAAATVRGSVASLRTLLVDLYPARLADAGLVAALTDLARPLSARGIEVAVDVDPAAVAQLAPGAQQTLHRVARECLRNVVRHASARHVTLSVALGADADGAAPTAGADSVSASATGEPGIDGTVVMRIEDDGVGFDPAAVAARQGHLGLHLVADLATELGATLQVCSAPGWGTSWLLVLPVGGRR